MNNLRKAVETEISRHAHSTYKRGSVFKFELGDSIISLKPFILAADQIKFNSIR